MEMGPSFPLLIIDDQQSQSQRGDLTQRAEKQQGLYSHLQCYKSTKQLDDNYYYNVISIHSHSTIPSEAIVSEISVQRHSRASSICSELQKHTSAAQVCSPGIPSGLWDL